MAFVMTRIKVGDYDAWKPSFDKDLPGAREKAKGYRLFRNVDDPAEVFVMVEFGSAEDAQEGAGRLRESAVESALCLVRELNARFLDRALFVSSSAGKATRRGLECVPAAWRF
jgi:hypothetical protein